MKKTIAVFLLLVLCLPLFSACAGLTESNDYTAYVDTEIEIPDEKVYDDSTTKLVTEKYGDNHYDGHIVRILGISPGAYYYYHMGGDASEIWYEEDSADVQRHAVVQRNILTEDLLDVKIELQGGGDPYDLYDLARTNAKAGVDDFDLMQTANFRGLLSGMLGYFHNLYDVDTFDMDAYWWNQEYVNTYTLEFDTLSTITGDCFIYDDLALRLVYYNTAMVENFNLEDPTLLVESGEWTIAKMMELAAAVTSDSDGDGEMTANDTWGVLDNNHLAIINYFDGCGVRLAKKDENDVPYLAAEEADFVETVQYVFEHIERSGYVHADDMDNNLEIMKDDRGLFMEGSLLSLFDFRDMESDFRVLPMPKYNLDRESYSAVVSGDITTVLAIPITVKDTDRVGVFMNVFGGYSTDTVDRSLNEVILGAKLVRDKRTIDMMEYCRASKAYDWGKDLKWAFPIYQEMADQGYRETFYFASAIKRVARQSRAMLKQMLGGYSFY